MKRRRLRKKVFKKLYLIVCLALIITGWTKINKLQEQKIQLESKLQSMTQQYRIVYEECVETKNRIIEKERKNIQKEEEISVIWNVVFNWNSVTYEEASEVEVGFEYKKHILIDMLNDFANSLSSTPTNREKIQKCEHFIDDVRSMIGTTGIAENAISYGRYLIRVFSARK